MGVVPEAEPPSAAAPALPPSSLQLSRLPPRLTLSPDALPPARFGDVSWWSGTLCLVCMTLLPPVKLGDRLQPIILLLLVNSRCQFLMNKAHEEGLVIKSVITPHLVYLPQVFKCIRRNERRSLRCKSEDRLPWILRMV